MGWIMKSEIVDKNDLLVMKLVHYFITRKDYHPIIIRGIEDEVWLENKKGDYSIIRIVTRHILNNEQFEYDKLKTKHIAKQIKRKIFDFSMNMLSIYVDSDFENIKINEEDKKYISVFIKSEEDLFSNDIILNSYKNIKEEFINDNDDFETIGQITRDINEKSKEELEKRDKIMKNRKPILTYILILINVLVFIMMYVYGNGSEDIETLKVFGANYIPYVKSGEYIRLLSSAFVHIGVIHLLSNMYALYVIGRQVEQLYGKVKYILIYLLSAIMGSLFTVVFSSYNTTAAGASGAIFGLLGSLLYFGYTYRGYIGNGIINQVLPAIILNLIIGFSNPSIGNSAHIGGLVGGYLVSMALGIDIEKDNKSKVNGIIITILLTLFMIYMGFVR